MIGNPLGVVTPNRLDNVFFCLVVCVSSEAVTTGGGAVMDTVKGDQVALPGALQAVPSKARICRLLLTVPDTKLVCANCAAVMSITVRAGLATPFTTKWPLLGSLEPLQSS